MPQRFIQDSKTVQRLRSGGLGQHIDGFADLLSKRGYRDYSITYRLRIVGALDTWLNRRRIETKEINEEVVGKFIKYRLSYRRPHKDDKPGLRLFLDYLREQGVICRPQQTKRDRNPLAGLLREYDDYLEVERGVAVSTRRTYVPLVHDFLISKSAEEACLRKLCARDVSQYLLGYCQRYSKTRAQLLVTALRSFLRFAFAKGLICSDLAPCVPAVAFWKRGRLPKAIPKNQVIRLLQSCDRRNSIGRRDYAILLLLARLGLRCREIVMLSLDDIHWSKGQIAIRGKGPRYDWLPLPADVGKAIAAYLRRGRPNCATRRLFVRAYAPIVGISGSPAIFEIARRAAERAGLDPSTISPHRLRHSVATEMLRHGATLREISEILRHRHTDTTAIYAKVDLNALRKVVEPWPGVRSNVRANKSI